MSAARNGTDGEVSSFPRVSLKFNIDPATCRRETFRDQNPSIVPDFIAKLRTQAHMKASPRLRPSCAGERRPAILAQPISCSKFHCGSRVGEFVLVCCFRCLCVFVFRFLVVVWCAPISSLVAISVWMTETDGFQSKKRRGSCRSGCAATSFWAMSHDSSSCGAWRRTSIFPGRLCVCCAVLRTPAARSVSRVRRGAAPEHHSYVPGSTWSCLLLRIVLQDALSEVMKVCPPLKLRVFVDDIGAFMKGRNKVLPGIAEEVLRSMKMEVEEKGLRLSITEGERRRQEQGDCVILSRDGSKNGFVPQKCYKKSCSN